MKRKYSKKVKKQFVQKVAVENVPPSKAVAEIFSEKNLKPETSHKYAVNLFKDKDVKKEIVSILNEIGMTQKGLSIELKTLIESSKKESTKLKAIEMGFKLHGHLVKGGDQTKKDVKILNLFIKNSRERGIELPVDIKKAMSEMIEQNKEEELITPAEVESE